MRRIPPRTLQRLACELECSIEATNVTPERKAVMRNLSQTGARLEGPELDGCPDAFDLRVLHESGAVERLNARCVWRALGAIGVRFEGLKAHRPRRGAASLGRAI